MKLIRWTRSCPRTGGGLYARRQNYHQVAKDTSAPSAQETSITDAPNHATFCSTDSSGDRLTESDAFGNTTYTYNSFGQVLTATDPIGGVWTYTLVIRNGMMLTLIGLALGLAGAFALTRLGSTICLIPASLRYATERNASLVGRVARFACRPVMRADPRSAHAMHR